MSTPQNRPPTPIHTSMPLPSFHDWLEHRVEEVPDIGNLMLLIARSGAGGGISFERLRKVTKISPDTLDDLLRALITTGQVVAVQVNGERVYRAVG